MKTYHNQKWNFSLDYPEDWEVVLENEPEGGWELVVGVAGKPTLSSRPVVTVHVAPFAVLDFFAGNTPAGAAGWPTASVGLPHTVEEYNQVCKESIVQRLPDVQLISEEKGVLAGMASGALLYSFRSKTGIIREKQVNIFGTAATYRLVCEGPEEQSESVEKYFDSVVASFVPFAGRTITSAAEGNSAFVAAESHYQPASYTTTTYYIKEGLCPTCGRNFGAITGWEFGPTIIRCKDCRTVIDAHDQWKDWLSLPAGTKTRLVFINVGIPIMGILVILAFMLAIAPDVQNWELPILLGIGLLLFMVVVFVFIPFFRRVSESKKLSKENRIPEW